jgi:hypothetical protein
MGKVMHSASNTSPIPQHTHINTFSVTTHVRVLSTVPVLTSPCTVDVAARVLGVF